MLDGKTLQSMDGPAAAPVWLLRLYVAGASPHSLRAIANLQAFCEAHMHHRYTLEVVDVYQQPGLAKEADIVALPMLLCLAPLPVRKFIGDMSNEKKLRTGLGIE